MNKRIIIAFGIAAAAVVIILAAVQLSRHRGGSSPVPASSRAELNALLGSAKELEQKNSFAEAGDAYRKLIIDFPNSSEVMNWQKKTEELTMRIFYSSAVTPRSVQYEVKPGDSLFRIAKEHKTTPELIMKMNNMSDTRIIPGRKLKVWNAPFTLFVDKSQNTLILKSGEDVMKTFVVSTGENNSTPVGTFKITTKLVNPTWFKAGAIVPPSSDENQLGTRWMGFDLAGYGIHGTIRPDQLGRQVTAGCVRMANSDAEELYDIVTSGTEVTIVD